MKIVILAGGRGTRLWPLSRNSYPKQFLNFQDNFSLLQKSVRRFLSFTSYENIFVVTHKDYFYLVQSQLIALDPKLKNQIILEPEGKNTAPAIALAIKFLEEKEGAEKNETIFISPSDSLILPEDNFQEEVFLAGQLAKQGHLVTFGALPSKPETGYGYIQVEQTENKKVFKASSFVEKPPLATAIEYMSCGNFLWNCGSFCFTVEKFWQELETYCPSLAKFTHCSYEEFLENFSLLPSLSIDYAILEKSKDIIVITLHAFWSDLGTWDAVYETCPKDENQNVKIGNIAETETKNCLLFGDKRLISTLNLEDLIIIDTEDALFVGKKGDSQNVKIVVEKLKAQEKQEALTHLTSYRPWGNYTVLEEGPRYKIKKITVSPLQKLSLQLHYHRSEHWVVVKGTAKVTIDEKEILLHENESIFIPKSSSHRLENPGKVPLELIEVQVGEYVGEDDIVRLEDIYGRENISCQISP